MDTTAEALAEDLAVDPGDVRVILRQHDIYADELSHRNAYDVRLTLDPEGERSQHNNPPAPWYGLGSRHSPTAPED